MTAETASGLRYAFHDARDQLGHLLEVYEPSPGVLALYAMVAGRGRRVAGRRPGARVVTAGPWWSAGGHMVLSLHDINKGDGTVSVETETKETLDRELVLRIYETVARIRAFDDKAQALIRKAEAFFTHYPVRGHEIISAAVAAAIEPDDYMTVTYRGHGRRGRQGRAAARAVGRGARQADRHLEGPRRTDAHRRSRARPDAVHRHRRRRDADRRRPRPVLPAEGGRQGHDQQLRRRRHEHRRVPRVAQPGVGVVAAGRVRLPEQPVRRAHPLLGHGQEPVGRRPRRGLRDEGHQGRRHGPGGDVPGGQGGRRPRPQRRRSGAARVRDVPDARPRAQRQERVHGPGPARRRDRQRPGAALPGVAGRRGRRRRGRPGGDRRRRDAPRSTPPTSRPPPIRPPTPRR